METKKYFPTVEAIENASRVLDEIIEPTPFMRNSNLSDLYDADVYLKREDLQIVRSYKIRGAYNKIRSIEPEVLKYGIVCASAGNHAPSGDSERRYGTDCGKAVLPPARWQASETIPLQEALPPRKTWPCYVPLSGMRNFR